MRTFHAMVFGILLATASAQTTNQTQTPPVNSSTSATSIGSGAQTKAGTPAPASSGTAAGQANPTGTGQAPGANEPLGAGAASGAQSMSGGVAGTAASSATQNADVQSSSGIAAMPDSDLQTQIQNALNKEPTLAGDSPRVTVTPDAINLAGSVNTGKEKVTATRIVQSYAANKKVVNHLQIKGSNGGTSPSRNSTNSDRSPSAENPATNPELNKGTEPASKPPRP